MIDFNSYMENIAGSNRLASKEGFTYCECSGIGGIEGVLTGYKKSANFICSTDTCEGRTIQAGGSWFQRRVYTVFLLSRYNTKEKGDREKKMGLCRDLFTQIKSRMIHDSNLQVGEKGYCQGVENLITDEVKYKELGNFLPGCTGLYFLISEDIPEDLCYNPEEWQEK